IFLYRNPRPAKNVSPDAYPKMFSETSKVKETFTKLRKVLEKQIKFLKEIGAAGVEMTIPSHENEQLFK
ncbi:28062_t:CDS:1, partial [Racocetra persica]